MKKGREGKGRGSAGKKNLMGEEKSKGKATVISD